MAKEDFFYNTSSAHEYCVCADAVSNLIEELSAAPAQEPHTRPETTGPSPPPIMVEDAFSQTDFLVRSG